MVLVYAAVYQWAMGVYEQTSTSYIQATQFVVEVINDSWLRATCAMDERRAERLPHRPC